MVVFQTQNYSARESLRAGFDATRAALRALLIRSALWTAAALGLAGCVLPQGTGSPTEDLPQSLRSRAFSANSTDMSVPRGWETWLFGPTKPATQYTTIQDPLAQRVVVHAHAVRSASALLLPLDPKAPQPLRVSWSWRALGLIEGADVSEAAREDSPVRLLLGFDGDHSRLSFHDQMFAERVKLVSGQEMPYAILMYVWANHQAVETIVPNPHTGRIRMLVIESGAAHIGSWQSYSRDIAADFRRAYGEDPGPLVMVGIMTDTDNTGTIVDSDYGDIELEGRAATSSQGVSTP